MMDARRLAMLEAMDVEVLALRARTHACARDAASIMVEADASVATVRESESPSIDATGASLCIVCACGVRRDARLTRLLTQIGRALGLRSDAIDWLEADTSGTLPAPPAVPAYLVLGATLAPALGAQLSTAQQNATAIAVSADTANLPGDASGKRALWQLLKPIARRLAAERA